ncbi:MAG TPA: hypothetical protein VGJ15_04025, partial [Pirellulales bacterium]
MKTTSVAVATLAAALLMLFVDRIAGGQTGSPLAGPNRNSMNAAQIVVAANSNSRPDAPAAAASVSTPRSQPPIAE